VLRPLSGFVPVTRRPEGDRVVIESVHRRAVEAARHSDRLDHRNNLVCSEPVENIENEFAFEREAGDRPSFGSRRLPLTNSGPPREFAALPK